MDDRTEVLRKIRQLLQLYQSGKLGGSTMPEDSNPGFPRGSKENYTYFTLPMALNYQRNSYNSGRPPRRQAATPRRRMFLI